jgi:hypothetical protein
LFERRRNMQFTTKITEKDLGFINNVDLRNALLERLSELDRVFSVNGNFSTVFLAISTIEGIFKHLADIFKAELKRSSKYPTNNGVPRKFDRLRLEELYLLLEDIGRLPSRPDIDRIYSLLRTYRNFIHPQAQVRKRWTIGLGEAQMALGLLNATVAHLTQYVFLGNEVFVKRAGNPDYNDFTRVLHLQMQNTRLNSLLILDRPVSDTLSFSFDLELPQNSLLNFVFNFVDDGDFKMLRLDNREGMRNCVLRCPQKYRWSEILYADPEHPPPGPKYPVTIEIDFHRQIFALTANGNAFSFKDAGGNVRDLFDELQPGLKTGFFNEVGAVKLLNLTLSYGSGVSVEAS